MPIIRRATPEDAAAIAIVNNICWPDQNLQAAHVADVIMEPDHGTIVAEGNGSILGFCDGFMTLSEEGTRRWEVDLLAVHPDARRLGIGWQMTKACTAAGRDFGAAFARALIHIDNTASQRTFSRLGYTQEPTTCRLMIATEGGDAQQITAPYGSHLIPVSTFGYRGIWVEGIRSQAAFIAAKNIRARHGWNTAGAVIPLSHQESLQAAGAAGYLAVGDYQWFTLYDALLNGVEA